MGNHSEIHGGDLSTLTAVNCRRMDAAAEREKAVKDHAENLARLDHILADCRAREGVLLADLDLARIDRAKKIVVVGCLWPSRWACASNKVLPPDYSEPPIGSRVALLGVAVNDLASAKDEMKRHYFGLKDYDRWSHQREDHEYGSGPRHGSIVFRIGLTDDARKQDGLTLQQRDDAIYYLRNLERIQKAEGDAKQSKAA